MNYKIIALGLVTGVVTIQACKTKKPKETTVVIEEVKTETAVVKPGYRYNPVPGTIDFQDMDPTVDPKADFYHFANGTWVKENPVPATENRWSNFNVLQDQNNLKLKAILEDASSGKYPKGDHRQLVGDYYFTYMDSVKRNADGINPIKADLAKIDAIKSKKDLPVYIAYQHNYGIHSFYNLGIDQDLKDIDLNITYINQSGLLLPNRDYYFKEDTSSVQLRTKYVAHLTKMFGFLGYKPEAAAKSAKNILAMETKLAKVSMGPVELRNIEAQYNKMTVANFKKSLPAYDISLYLSGRDLAGVKEIVVGQPEFFKGLNTLLAEEPLENIKDYLKIQFFEAAASKLSEEIDQEIFDFFSTTLRGTKKMKKRWERGITAVSWTSIGEALGHAFVDVHFKPESKKKVNEMVDNIMIVFRTRLKTLEWMGASTKDKAIEKLESFTRKLGYPDKWTDYSKLIISRESYFKNWMAASYFGVRQNTEKFGKPIDRGEWQMAPHIVNAYYNPPWNEIVFPAGIMQPPFFDIASEDAVNYARMGAVIGHEFLHGFDDQGAQFDASGKFVNWWTTEDSLKFTERTKKLVAHFNSFEPLPGVFVNGELTLGENIADLGGLTMAYYAYQYSLQGKESKVINNFTAEQRFFIAFAQVWKENHTEKSMKLQVFTNPHSPGIYRVIGPLSNMPEFFDAFDVNEGDPMRQPKDKISLIW